jgi:hypothetical protein
MSEAIRTSVGWATFGDNLFRGHSIAMDLFEQTTTWSALSLGLGNRRLSSDESAFLDDLALAISAADPRIWPLKVAWLVGCYGSAFAGVAAVHQFIARCGVGPGVAPAAGRLWLELDAAAEGTPDRRGAIIDFLAGMKARGEILPGFGVPGRHEDERLALVRRTAVNHHRDHMRFFRLLQETDDATESLGVRVNVVAAAAACYLDLGFAPAELGPIMLVSMLHTLWANAAEAARLQPTSLRCVDLDDVDYLGRPERALSRTE